MPTVVVGDFEWDENKAAANERKHGVTFVEAMTAFLDEHGIAAPDTERPGRFVLIGMSRALRVLFVVSAEARRARPACQRTQGFSLPAQEIRKWPVRARPI